MGWDENYFRGQQEGERVLYLIRPHYSMFWTKSIVTTFVVLLVAAGWWRGGVYIEILYPNLSVLVWSVVIIGYCVTMFWHYKYAANVRTFVTERRIVRFEPSFPVTESRRSLFWRDVLKTKTLSDTILARLAKVGSLEVVPCKGNDQGLRIPWVYYHEDLANYFDKIVYLTNAEPEGLKRLRPFVARPAWERYPEIDLDSQEEEFLEVDYYANEAVRMIDDGSERQKRRVLLKLPK